MWMVDLTADLSVEMWAVQLVVQLVEKTVLLSVEPKVEYLAASTVALKVENWAGKMVEKTVGWSVDLRVDS